MRWVVPAEGDGSQHRHQPTAVILAMLRISFALALVNAVFWSTQWSTQMMSHQDEHCGCHQNVTQWQFHGAGHEPPPVPTYIYTCCYTDWVQTLVTTISYLLRHLNGSLTCPSAMPHRHAVYGDYRVCDGGWQHRESNTGQSPIKEPVRGRYAVTKKRTGHHRWSTEMGCTDRYVY